MGVGNGIEGRPAAEELGCVVRGITMGVPHRIELRG